MVLSSTTWHHATATARPSTRPNSNSSRSIKSVTSMGQTQGSGGAMCSSLTTAHGSCKFRPRSRQATTYCATRSWLYIQQAVRMARKTTLSASTSPSVARARWCRAARSARISTKKQTREFCTTCTRMSRITPFQARRYTARSRARSRRARVPRR